MLSDTAFIRLADVAPHLPSYDERVYLLALDDHPYGEQPSGVNGAGGISRGGVTAAEPPVRLSQAACYRRLSGDLRQAVQAALSGGSKRLLATYLQVLLAYPDACTRGETVVDPRSGEVIAHAPPLPEDALYPKEQALVELVRRERERRRRVLAFVTHTDLRDLTPRLTAVLSRAGLRPAVLKASTVPPDRREDWIAARAREGTDVLLAIPRLVQTGLDYEESDAVSRAKVASACYSPSSSRIHVSSPASRSWSAASSVG